MDSKKNMNSDSSNLPAGASLQGGKYRIVKVLGQGGFGITYLAVQTGLGMKVAIKEFFLKGSCQRDTATSEVSVPVTDNAELVTKCLKKFKSEARKIASLNHDHIVSIIDIFDENGTSYYVMKHLGGGSLADRVKNGAMREEDALKVINEISDALKTIHSHGLLHLDIKPANILFDERGRSILIDFGVSKYVDSDKDTTTTSSLVGFSRGFAPLEQMNATVSTLTPATDIYALGATLYNLVVGTIPPEASLVMDSGLPEMPSVISHEVKNAITCSMQPRRKDRPQDVDSFLKLLPEDGVELEEIPVQTPIDEDTVIVQKTEPVRPVQMPVFKRYALAFSATMLLAAIVIALTTLMKQPEVNDTPAEDYKAQVSELTKQVNTLTTNNNDLRKQVNDLKNTESSSNSSNATLRRQVNDLNKQVNDLKDQNTTLSTRITDLERDNSNLRNQVNSYRPDAERWRRQMEVNN